MFGFLKLFKKDVAAAKRFTQTCNGCKFPMKCVEVGDCFKNMEKEFLKRQEMKKVKK